MTSKLIKYTVLLIIVLNFLEVRAQRQPKIEHVFQQELENLYGTWRHSSNAAGLKRDSLSGFSILEAGYFGRKGNFRRPQDASGVSQVGLRADGNTRVQNYDVQGYFNYKRDNRRGGEYNAALIYPLDLMPYRLADTNASDWLNQHYSLGFDLASPIVGKGWNAGLSVDYQASSGAKQRDIRARNNRYTFQIRPGVVYKIAPKHVLGANLSYENRKEESNNYNINVYVDQGYFMLYGLGHHVRRLGFENLSTSSTTNYTGDELGAGLQYEYLGNWRWFAAVNYELGADDAHIDFTNTRPEGTLLRKGWGALLKAQHTEGQWGHIAQIAWNSTDAKGIEYINEFVPGVESDGYETRFQSVRSTYHASALSSRYELVKHKGRAHDFRLRLDARYGRQMDRYLIPGSHLEIEQLSYGAAVQKVFRLNESVLSMISVGLEAMLSQNLKKSYHYGGHFSDSQVITDLMKRDFAFLSSDYLQIVLPLVYSQRISKTQPVSLYVKATGYYTKAEHDLFTDRQAFGLSIGSTF